MTDHKLDLGAEVLAVDRVYGQRDDRPLRYKSRKELVDECVEVFLSLSDSACTQARGKATGFDGITNDQAQQAARLAWSALQRARLFCFAPDRWVALYEAADRYTTDLAGNEWRPGRSRLRFSPDEIQLDGHAMFGVPRAQAEANGWIRWTKTGPEITEAGWTAFNERLGKLPEDKRTGINELLALCHEAEAHERKDLIAIAVSQIEETLFEEPKENVERLLQCYETYGVQWPFPDPLPFDACFFCFGRRLNLSYSPIALHTRVHAKELSKLGVASVYLLGYLVAWEADVPFAFAVLQFGDGDGRGGVLPGGGGLRGSSVGLIRIYEDGEWQQPMSLDPWILSMLVKAVNDHKSILEAHPHTLSTRLARKQASKDHKQLLPLPAPFYLLDLKDELITMPAKRPALRPGRPIEWSHRWDVRGHECVRVERGELPPPPGDVAKLKKRGYRIYEGMSLSADDAARLLKRGVRAPGPREWIAVLSYWRDSFIKGPTEKPYVPAARTEPRI